jgi:uncharacterized protein DUF4384
VWLPAHRKLPLLMIVGGGVVWAQDAGLSARELYYQAVAPTPPVQQNVSTATGQSRQPTRIRNSSDDKGRTQPDTQAAVVPVATRLGLRYNLLRIDPQTRASESVDPDANFVAGDCLALRMTPNRTGHLYVFNRGAAGSWQPLMPSPKMPGENTTVNAGNSVQIPQNYCFRIDETRGTERLLVIVSQKDENFDQLNREMQNLIPGSNRNKSSEPGAPELQIASTQGVLGADDEAKLMQRDLKIEKITEPRAADEPANAVYVVNAQTANRDRLLLEIPIRHE